MLFVAIFLFIYDFKWIENFKSQFFRIFFWKPLFSTFYATLFIVSRKYFFGFSKSAPTPRYTILDSRLPPCNAISEGRPPLSNTSSEAGALPLKVRIENDSDRKFSKSKFFIVFLETTFLPILCYLVHCEPKVFFWFFEVCTYPSIHNFGLEASPL